MMKKDKKKNGLLRIVRNLVAWLLVAAVVFTAIALVGVRFVGLKPFAVLSGSMEPAYKTGSIIYVRSVDYKTLKAGDPVTFMLDENTIVTHRIVEVIPDPDEAGTIRYRTKGDANDTEDGGLVHYKNVIGKPVLTIPYLGYLADYIQHPPGMYVAVAVCALLMFLAFLPDLFEDDGEEHKAGDEKEGDLGGKGDSK